MTLQYQPHHHHHHQQQLLSIHSEVREGLEFILRHFDDSFLFLLPRKISTFKSNNKQFLVRSKQEIIDAFKQSDFLDCRINGYPYLTDYKDVPRFKPDFFFIDLDKNNFKNDRNFDKAFSNTLKNINEQLDGYPTVLDTGGGYHIYQPIFCPTALENVTEFQKFDNKPSVQFLRFAKNSLSNGKADKNNNPSFRSCLLRVPGSINSKYNKQITIIQKWDGIRPNIPLEFMEDFRTYLIQKKIDEYNNNHFRQRQQKQKRNHDNLKNNQTNHYYYQWIEKLLQTPIEDYRKLVLWKILCPYLINVRKLSYYESFQILKEWLDKCDSLKKLDFNANQKIRNDLKDVGEFYPIGLQKLKIDDKYSKLYQILNEKIYLLLSS